MKNITKISNQIRFQTCKLSHQAKAAHLGSALSCVDILTVIFFSDLFKFDIRKNSLDKFILSKGHAAAALYSCLAFKKFISFKKLNEYGKNNSVLEEHPNKKINGVICSTGSLGHGLSFGCGITLGEKIKNLKNKNVVLLSDGECNEGSIWEAAGFASSKKLNNLIALIDFNNWQATGRSKEIFGGEMKKKWQAFGWNVMDINGNNTKQIYNALKKAKKSKKKPTAIICNTIKGKGIKFMEDNNNWHYRVPTKNELKVIEKILMQ